ncbi:FAD-binding protein [Propionibacteriaceae bacterium Y2011]
MSRFDAVPATEGRRLTGWGLTMASRSDVVRPRTPDEAIALVRELADSPGRGLTARGLGRSYGDPAQNTGGTTIELTGLDKILSVDAEADEPTVDVQAGVSLDTLMKVLLPFGLWIPVLPGTRQVTIGGAIGADVHGKNHHTQGSFGNHVRSIDLLTADGEVSRLTPDGPDSELFWATIGGMGLTGLVLRATVAVQRVTTAYFSVDTDQVDGIDDLMTQMSARDDDYTYSVAWFDAVTSGEHMGRAVLTLGNKATLEELPEKLARNPLKFSAPSFGTVPPVFPNGMVNALTARVFSEFWFRKAPRRRRGEIQNITQFFHPLDVAQDWNRVYGPAGFLQYQFVVPFGAEDVFRRCLELITSSEHYSCLNVLKRFGEGNRAPLSFPTPGWTLTADFSIKDGLDTLCAELDAEVLGAGGRLYLAKDSRMAAADFATMYPRLPEFREVRRRVDPTGLFTSDMARRLEI